MRIYELLGIAGVDEDPATGSNSIIRASQLTAKAFEAAIRHFQTVLGIRPGDVPSAIMIDRCRDYLIAPPASD